jgi:hypothetical protein
MMNVTRSSNEPLDTFEAVRGKRFDGHGKNFDALIAAGAWVISGFNYGSAKCACCGRPIVRVLRLKNTSHDAALSRDPAYPFPEEIGIGIICGPKVFKESCAGFYTDPEREWERQHKVWKTYIKYVIACTLNGDVWERVPAELKTRVDDYLESGGTVKDPHSGNWWVVRDSKRLLLERTRRNPDREPIKWDLVNRSTKLLSAAKTVGVAPAEWVVTEDLQITTL